MDISPLKTPDDQPFTVPSRQLYPGTFDVQSRTRSNGATSVVGHVYVEGAGSNLIVEHWVLSTAYASPNNTQDMMVVQVTPGYNSLSAFLTAMHNLESQGANFQYVKAECLSFTSLPD